jgi:hypothetical protein
MSKKLTFEEREKFAQSKKNSTLITAKKIMDYLETLWF